ncbi:DUF2157 domain-containing protein [Acidobacteria bacterium AH-259-D05]|nr:DUF2157 domain-containing protein [Acidobacteria bacterium AH-259-D05]
MVNQNLINKWLKEGTITQEQAEQMRADLSLYREEWSSHRRIVALSTIGAVLLGLGVLLFVASNWSAIPNLIKTLLLLGSTFAAYYAGYLFVYQKQNFPRVGASLLFLGALLFGASVFLIAQIYHVNANAHTLVLIWLVGVLPAVYGFSSVAIAGLSSLLFFVWMGLFLAERISMLPFPFVLAFFVIAGVLLFGIGGLHYLKEDYKNIARTYRIAGIQVTMFFLFLLTFEGLSAVTEPGLELSAIQTMTFVLVFAFAAIVLASNWFFNPSKSNTIFLENIFPAGLLVLSLLFFFFPTTQPIYAIIFNLLFAGIALTLLSVGYQREDIKLVNIGMGCMSLLITVRYFDFFWDLFPRSIFFIVGGLILILGGISLEKKRRQLKEQFRT